MEKQTPPPAQASRAQALRRQLVTKVVGGLGAGIASMLSLGLAAYALARPEPVPVVGPDAAVDSGRWRIAVSGARFVPARPEGATYLDRSDSLQVELEVANLTAASDNTYARVLKSDPPLPAEAGEPTFMLARDKSIAGALHPDMPEALVAYWRWPAGLAVPEQLSFDISGEYYKPRDNLYGAPGWFPTAQPAAKIVVPVVRAGGAP